MLRRSPARCYSPARRGSARSRPWRMRRREIRRPTGYVRQGAQARRGVYQLRVVREFQESSFDYSGYGIFEGVELPAAGANEPRELISYVKVANVNKQPAEAVQEKFSR